MHDIAPHRIMAELLRARGIGQEELAKTLGLCRQSVNNKLTGRTAFTFEEAITICRTYKLNYSIFFE